MAAMPVIVVTGASGNLGLEMSAAMYHGGCTVVMAARNMKKLKKAKKIIEEKYPEGKGELELMVVDLADYDSIDAFVIALTKAHPKGVNVLINNAGIIPKSEYRESKYGYELTFQVNYLSTYVLTEKVIPMLEMASNEGGVARVVNVGTMSVDETSNPVDWSQFPRSQKNFGGYHVDYAESKWMLTTYTSALHRRFEKDYKGQIQAVTADPGIIPGSDMWDDQTCCVRFMARYVFYCFTKSASQGAATATYCAIESSDHIQSGKYYHSGVAYDARADCIKEESWFKLEELTTKCLATHEDMKTKTKEEMKE